MIGSQLSWQCVTEGEGVMKFVGRPCSASGLRRTPSPFFRRGIFGHVLSVNFSKCADRVGRQSMTIRNMLVSTRVARDKDFLLTCDAKGWGLLGIAAQLPVLPLHRGIVPARRATSRQRTRADVLAQAAHTINWNRYRED